MKTCTSCRQPKTLDEFYIRTCSPDGHGLICKPCAKARTSEWRALNRERHRAYSGLWKANNRERANEASRRDSGKPWRKAAVRKWNVSNPDKRAEAGARRRAKLVTPKWADASRISGFYREARRLTQQTGQPHHVDHIVPLNSHLVCGLHVESNMQVLPARENVLKRNLFWPDMP